ncbi:PepSY domain-containing protein [Lysobacter pythonis]|uniref:PepSY domain-containing protein n=1 Tax=Solilutibacter pythonis TaxID=2483112 RepID=A0A3M2HIA6_9GAMM|nr:PepSY-associated TM helix domain-containing protein [Lysobacter pythonis]RMH89461.1 PepSY domain-containing protein [Lysobacter pythonis]
MKVRGDIVKVYKDVHIWVGILSGLMLFVAFYAGAITMFEKPLERWATPPSALPPPPPLGDTQALIDAVMAKHPEAADEFRVIVETTADEPARLVWRVRGENRGDYQDYRAGFAPDGRLRVEAARRAAAAQTVDTLHQEVGLPFPAIVNTQIMGIVALMYAVALVSGVIVLLPTLAKDFFALRVGGNIKRMWLDAHNALGIVSLPFHLIIALTSVIFAFHTPIYAVQDKLVYPGGLQWPHEAPASPAGAKILPPQALLEKANAQLPGFSVESFVFRRNREGVVEGTVTGRDIRYGTRARTYSATHFDPYTGVVDPHDLPGRMAPYDSAVNTFFMLHFGSFGGNAVRWMYFLLGLAGAMVFYTGNLLWIESRRKKQRGTERPVQKRNTRVLGALTVGVSLGCVSGVSATLAAAKWLPARVENLAAWHEGVYFTVFACALAWAFLRGAARAAPELLRFSAVLTLGIPLSSLAGVWGIGGTWNHPGWLAAVDLTALAAVPALLWIARKSARRAGQGAPDSIWSARAPQLSG